MPDGTESTLTGLSRAGPYSQRRVYLCHSPGSLPPPVNTTIPHASPGHRVCPFSLPGKGCPWQGADDPASVLPGAGTGTPPRVPPVLESPAKKAVPVAAAAATTIAVAIDA